MYLRKQFGSAPHWEDSSSLQGHKGHSSCVRFALLLSSGLISIMLSQQKTDWQSCKDYWQGRVTHAVRLAGQLVGVELLKVGTEVKFDRLPKVKELLEEPVQSKSVGNNLYQQ